MRLTDPNKPPKANDPVSPINIFAGGALYHKKPSRQAPTVASSTIHTSETFFIFINFK